MKKPVKYSLATLAVIATLIFSFRIEKLDEYNATNNISIYNSEAYATELWKNKMPAIIQDAPQILPLIEELETNKQKAFEDFGKKLGISRTWYFMAKGEGLVDSLEEEYLWVNMGNHIRIQLATGFIFGNAVRDASGVANIDDFINMTDFNNVSVSLNKLVKNEVVRELKNSAEPGMKIEFAGAFEINEEKVNTDSIRVIPVSVKISNEE